MVGRRGWRPRCRGHHPVVRRQATGTPCRGSGGSRSRYVKSWFGRRMFFRNAGTKRGAMLFLMIGTKRSFFFIRLSRASTHRFSCDVALLDPDAVRLLEEQVVRQLRARVRRGDQRERRVVEHDRVGAALVEGQHGVRDAVHHDELRVREAALHPAVVDRAARRRDPLAADVGEALDRRVVLDEQADPSPCSRAARSRSACRGRPCT